MKFNIVNKRDSETASCLVNTTIILYILERKKRTVRLLEL